MSDLGASYGRVFRGMLGALFVGYGSYAISAALGRDWPGDELFPLYLLPVWWIALALLLFAYNWFSGVPFQEWGRHEDRIAGLERLLRPKFSVRSMVGQKPVYPAHQQVVATAGGQIQSNRALSERFLCIDVTNITANTLRRCEAYLSRFEDTLAEPMGWHAMRLAWMPVGDEGATVDIPPLGNRSVMVFRVLGNRPLFLDHRLPGDLIHSLKDGGEYHGLITLTADDAPVTLVAFRLSCSGPDHEPTISVMRSNIGEDEGHAPWALENHVV